MPKEVISASIEKERADAIRALSARDKWNRSFSQTLDILLQKGLEVVSKSKKP